MSNEEGLARVAPDSAVLFSRVLHELIGRLALAYRLFDVVWSDELLDETKRVLIREKPLSAEVAEKWVGFVRDAFPSGRVDTQDVPGDVDVSQLTNDPGDEHVCALAVAARADILLSSDTGYAVDALRARGVEVRDPDAFLVELAHREPGPIVAAVVEQAASWGGGRPL